MSQDKISEAEIPASSEQGTGTETPQVSAFERLRMLIKGGMKEDQEISYVPFTPEDIALRDEVGPAGLSNLTKEFLLEGFSIAFLPTSSSELSNILFVSRSESLEEFFRSRLDDFLVETMILAISTYEVPVRIAGDLHVFAMRPGSDVGAPEEG